MHLIKQFFQHVLFITISVLSVCNLAHAMERKFFASGLSAPHYAFAPPPPVRYIPAPQQNLKRPAFDNAPYEAPPKRVKADKNAKLESQINNLILLGIEGGEYFSDGECEVPAQKEIIIDDAEYKIIDSNTPESLRKPRCAQFESPSIHDNFNIGLFYSGVDCGLNPFNKNHCQKPIYKILSLFDGISCAQCAIHKLGINNYEYFASEIDSQAITITQKNYPKTIQIGDILNLTSENAPYDRPYLLVGGSPCQNLSSVGVRSGLKGEKSSLFYQFVLILKKTKPRYFLFENVASMSHDDKDEMTRALNEALGNGSKVQPIKINSSSFVPQTRRRYYWTNIPFNTKNLPPEDGLSTTAQDLLEKNVEENYYYKPNQIKRSFTKDGFNTKPESDLKIARPLKTKPYTGRATADNCYHMPFGKNGELRLRKLTPVEYERLQGLPDEYTAGISNTARYEAIGNSFTVPVIKWFLQYIFEANNSNADSMFLN